MKCELIEVSEDGQTVTVRILDKLDIQTFYNNIWNGRMFGYLEPWVNGTTTDDQRKHYWALIGDIANHLGWTKGKARLHTYSRYLFDNDREDIISLGRGKARKEETTLLIQACIDFCIENDIPMNNDYSSYFDNKQLYGLLMNRKCFICGLHGDIAHVEAVGMGRDRKVIDHTQHHLMCLCRKHHNEQHQIGIDSFMQKYQLRGIKVKDKDLKQLGVK